MSHPICSLPPSSPVPGPSCCGPRAPGHARVGRADRAWRESGLAAIARLPPRSEPRSLPSCAGFTTHSTSGAGSSPASPGPPGPVARRVDPHDSPRPPPGARGHGSPRDPPPAPRPADLLHGRADRRALGSGAPRWGRTLGPAPEPAPPRLPLRRARPRGGSAGPALGARSARVRARPRPGQLLQRAPLGPPGGSREPLRRAPPSPALDAPNRSGPPLPLLSRLAPAGRGAGRWLRGLRDPPPHRLRPRGGSLHDPRLPLPRVPGPRHEQPHPTRVLPRLLAARVGPAPAQALLPSRPCSRAGPAPAQALLPRRPCSSGADIVWRPRRPWPPSGTPRTPKLGTTAPLYGVTARES